MRAAPMPSKPSFASLKAALHQHRNDDDRALNRAYEVFADKVRQDHDVADHFENERAADRAPDAADAAAKARTADDDGGDGLQFPTEAGGRGRRAQARHIDEDGDRNAEPLNDVGQRAHFGDVDARIARDFLVGADRHHVAAKGGAIENEGPGHGNDHDDQNGDRNAEDGAEIDGPIDRAQIRG